uniref:Major facilitator superfamily domain containing 4A n=1 Tax=Junco hyemalis TaxID=40217 RepID=A0A8C5NI62_JUNHY
MWWDERVSARFRRNLQPTLTYWSVFFSFGLCIAFLGPTLLDLRCQTQSSLSQITWVFFSQQFCLLLGSCLGGVFKRTLAQSLLALFASSLAISLVFAIIPLCHNVVVLAVVMAVAGLAMGCIDTISNMQLVKIYQKDSAIFLQALHFFVGFGALLSPLIADPFLSDTNCILANGTANASSNLPHIRKSLLPHHPGNLSHYALPMKGMVVTRVSYAFWIMALINVSAAAARGSSWRSWTPHPFPFPSGSSEEDEGEVEPPELSSAPPGHEDLFSCCQSKNFRGVSFTYFAVHITGALVLFMTDGIVGEYSGFVYSYAVEEPLAVVHKVAGYLPSLFWGFITLGRLISIPVSYRMKPATMVFINVVRKGLIGPGCADNGPGHSQPPGQGPSLGFPSSQSHFGCISVPSLRFPNSQSHFGMYLSPQFGIPQFPIPFWVYPSPHFGILQFPIPLWVFPALHTLTSKSSRSFLL